MSMHILSRLSIGLLLTLNAGLALAGTAVIVNHQSTVENLGAEQVQKIFLGKISIVQKQGRLTPFDLPEGTIRANFYHRVIKKSSVQVTSHWAMMVFTGRAQPPEEVASEKDMVRLVANNPLAIGYVDQSQLDGTVKPVYLLP